MVEIWRWCGGDGEELCNLRKYRTHTGLDIKCVYLIFITNENASPCIGKELISFPACGGQYLKKRLVVLSVVHVVHIFN